MLGVSFLQNLSCIQVREEIINANIARMNSEKGVFLDGDYYYESDYTYAFTQVKNTIFR